jgi:mannose-6-phosphate isomerase-like protein (cupin superfamily)
MKSMKIAQKDAQGYGKAGLKAFNYPLPRINGGTSIVYAELTKEHGESTAEEKARIYYILDGEGEFVINGEEIKAGKGDVVVVPPQGIYNYWPVNNSTLKFLLSMEYFTLK